MAISDIKVKISAITTGFDQAMTKVETSLKNLSRRGDTTAGAARKWGSRFTAAGQALAPVSAAAGVLTGATIKLGAEYGKQMGKVQAISGATGVEMQKLKTLAMDATKGTKFSAIEAGQAMEYMGMAGWKTGDMINGLTPILNLATASGEDLATTSDIVTDALTGFGLKAQDAAMFTDVLAAASTNSNTTVKGMGETFKYAAPIAGALGYSIQDTALAIGLMANAGIKGSQAGTALRTAMTSLSAPTSQAKRAMDKLGISITDSQGKMLPFRDVIGQLREKFKGLSKEQQIQAAKTIFGQEAMSGMLAIINASEEDYNKLAGAIDNSSGAAQKMADTMSDTSSIETATARIKNAFISVGDAVAPFVSKVADGIRKVAEKFQELPAPLQAVIFGFVAFLAVLSPLLLFVGGLLTTFAMVSAVMSVLGISVGLLMSGFIAIVAVIGAVIAVGVALYQNWDTIKEKALQLWEGIKETWNRIKEGTRQAWESLKQRTQNDWNNIKTTVTSKAKQLWQGIKETWNVVKSGTQQAWSSIKSRLSNDWNNIKSTATNIFNNIKTAISNKWNEIKSNTSSVWNSIKSTVTNILNQIKSTFTNMMNQIKSAVTNGMNNVKSAFRNGLNSAKSTITGMIGGFVSAGRSLIQGVARGIQNGASAVISAARSAAQRALNAAKSFLGINSPSRVMEREVGRWIPAGMAVGIETNLDSLRNASKVMTEMVIPEPDVSNIDVASTMKFQNDDRNREMTVNTDKEKPAYINLRFGRRKFRGLVKDISKEQNSEAELNEVYGI